MTYSSRLVAPPMQPAMGLPVPFHPVRRSTLPSTPQAVQRIRRLARAPKLVAKHCRVQFGLVPAGPAPDVQHQFPRGRLHQGRVARRERFENRRA